MALQILRETEQDVVVVKPVGVDAETEMPKLLEEQLGGSFFCVHRLDLGVGGVMIYARTREAAAHLSKEIAEGRMTKEYLCLCSGAFDTRKGMMKDLLLKDNEKKKSYVVSRPRRGVKDAVLYYEVLKTFGDPAVSLVHVILETGRYHQIRAQFASRKHPLLGDGKYGSRVRQDHIGLYSVRLSVSGETVTYIPEELRHLVTEAEL